MLTLHIASVKNLITVAKGFLVKLWFTRNVFIQNFFFLGGGEEGLFKIIVLFLLSDVEHSCLPGSLHSVRIKTKSLLKS